MEFGDEARGGDPVPADLTMPPAPLGQDVLPPAQGALSLEHQEFRREVCSPAKSAFTTSTAPGAVRTYEATSLAAVPKVTAKSGSQVLPMSPEAAFYAFFSAVAQVGAKAASSVSAQPAVRRGYVQLVKAAVAHWHVVRGSRAVFSVSDLREWGVSGQDSSFPAPTCPWARSPFRCPTCAQCAPTASLRSHAYEK